ncbi:hypothetical protein PR048_014933 [Dryococelus australis]|uniref:Uncharacterized protein n=1 Tax=Dryococelus australis TaxID=614101 RepID=A0ABQ9HFI8_9NEOP|nr:hypothetical protein PR048_014933 [Dryococelus australis]
MLLWSKYHCLPGTLGIKRAELPQEQKLQAILDATPPTNKKQLRQILGLWNWLLNYVSNIAHLMGPLHELLAKSCSWE